ncbi:MAG: toll/interleukin-1 receptor domain-containing protein [Pirellulaceae bacterium]|nr:toll/interleukin-1 receptor domain-containing protein [Planctomycetales bacterium]MCA9203292.1 toll/interleukin-1 receptor domain-containing protein [Planctomycetales bacterium]MCA9223311.1 toll/interleukin-1 receptor domain-containing protein [Planctomycetales bacterium]MCA9228973.1 toll/interleukin-1 receptor domain-containing protein [Planctomycetales bacterium]
MTTATLIYDVFISHGLHDKELAADVANRLQAAGLTPFHDASIREDEEVSQAIWDAIAECHAFIVIVSPNSMPDAMTMVELGAAAAWNKPILVLRNGPASMQLPDALRGYRAFPLSRLDEVLGQIRRGMEPISDDDRQVLAETYREFNVSADQLSQSPRSLQQLAEKFNTRSQKHLSGDRLLSELLRMRKHAKLPRLTRPSRKIS